MKKHNIPELLSPAGGMEQLRAAVQNGADAVYMGGPLFNARIKAENFTKDDMAKAIAYAHERNVKIYITLNTLIKDSELFEAISYVEFLYTIGADAVILQDMGLARLIKMYLPEMPMHLSTQGTVYNKWAVGIAKRLGFCRIVPARELSLAEIKDFSAECHKSDGSGKPCEVEVFVHGALCMCYSGQCQMSRILGGNSTRSGNRGMCAQPCRLPYEDDKGRKSFLLSPKDICTLENIPQLCQAGIDSFKIEGRLKSPQYVAVVTSIYRKYLDMYRDTGYVKVDADDKQDLLQIFNRGGFTTGYLTENPGQGLLSGESPKNKGIYIGKVKGFRKGSTLVDIETIAPIAIGDGVEIRSRKITGSVTGNVLSYMKELQDGSIRVGDIKGKVSIGDHIYKVTDKQLLAKAERSFASDSGKKIPVEMKFTAKIGKLPKLCIWEAESIDKENCRSQLDETTDDYRGSLGDLPVNAGFKPLAVEAMGNELIEKARNKPTEPERVSQQLSKLGDTPLEAINIEIDMEEGAIVPISAINKLRREAADKLIKLKRHIDREPLGAARLEEICRKEGLGVDVLGRTLERLEQTEGSGQNERSRIKTGADERNSCAIYVYSRETFEKIICNEDQKKFGTLQKPTNSLQKPLRVYVPLELYMEAALSKKTTEDIAMRELCKKRRGDVTAREVYEKPSGDTVARDTCKTAADKNIEMIPYVLNISRGNLDRYIEENFCDIVDKVRGTGIALGNLGWIEQFLEAGVPVYGDYGLNVYNRQSEKCFEEMGVEVRAYSHEAEMFFCGNIPLMITEHPILSEKIIDRKNKKYTILRWHSADKYLIFKDERDEDKNNKSEGELLKFRELKCFEQQINYMK